MILQGHPPPPRDSFPGSALHIFAAQYQCLLFQEAFSGIIAAGKLAAAELHIIFSVCFKKTEATNWQAISAPQADCAWHMPKVELVAYRRFYIKIPTFGFTSKIGPSENFEPTFSSGHY